MSSSPVPLKTRRVGDRCTENMLKAQVSSRWCGVHEKISFLGNLFEKVFVLLDCVTASSEEFVAVDDDIVLMLPIMADKDILEFVHSLKNIIDADSDNENEKNNASPVLPSSNMRNVMKSLRSYFDIHSKVEMNDKMDNTEQFVAKKTMHLQKLNKWFVSEKTLKFCFTFY
ncbi:hypothetical protein TNCV_571091 [Trichonephila clavipes]|nr:hypothetical protein TNCV_571091 [Trichonephila clavipes]